MNRLEGCQEWTRNQWKLDDTKAISSDTKWLKPLYDAAKSAFHISHWSEVTGPYAMQWWQYDFPFWWSRFIASSIAVQVKHGTPSEKIRAGYDLQQSILHKYYSTRDFTCATEELAPHVQEYLGETTSKSSSSSSSSSTTSKSSSSSSSSTTTSKSSSSSSSDTVSASSPSSAKRVYDVPLFSSSVPSSEYKKMEEDMNKTFRNEEEKREKERQEEERKTREEYKRTIREKYERKFHEEYVQKMRECADNWQRQKEFDDDLYPRTLTEEERRNIHSKPMTEWSLTEFELWDNDRTRIRVDTRRKTDREQEEAKIREEYEQTKQEGEKKIQEEYEQKIQADETRKRDVENEEKLKQRARAFFGSGRDGFFSHKSASSSSTVTKPAASTASAAPTPIRPPRVVILEAGTPEAPPVPSMDESKEKKKVERKEEKKVSKPARKEEEERPETPATDNEEKGNGIPTAPPTPEIDLPSAKHLERPETPESKSENKAKRKVESPAPVDMLAQIRQGKQLRKAQDRPLAEKPDPKGTDLIDVLKGRLKNRRNAMDGDESQSGKKTEKTSEHKDPDTWDTED